MIAILKRAGKEPETVQCEQNTTALENLIGGAYESIGVLAGAMVLCRAENTDLPENCQFLGKKFRGDILIVGRGQNNEPTNIPPHLLKIIPLALGGGKK